MKNNRIQFQLDSSYLVLHNLNVFNKPIDPAMAGRKLRIAIPGGSGHVGTVLARHFHNNGHDVTVLSRSRQRQPWQVLPWNGRDMGDWAKVIDGSDVVINLTGRSVNCRYNAATRREITESRVLSTRILGQAIAQAAKPPALWMNASSATVYRNSFEKPMSEYTGEIGEEKSAPSTWHFSIDVIRAWEHEFFSAATPSTRKIALRMGMIMSPDSGGTLETLLNLVRFGLGGKAGSGKQYLSWIHEGDFARAIEFLIQREDMDGCINITGPKPICNADFMSELRRAAHAPFGLPAAEWMLEIGTFFLRTESELILKSRRAIPQRLLDAGFTFAFPDWSGAADDLVRRWKENRALSA